MYKEEVQSNHYNRGTKYLNAKNYDKAISFFKKQLRTHSFKELHLNLGNCYRMLNNVPAAEQQYILAANPDTPFATGEFGPYALGLNNLGLHYFACGEEEMAQELYMKAIEVSPDYGEAKWNMSISLLRNSNCSSKLGWEMYEYRFDRGAGSVAICRDVPWWDFASTGDSIVVMTEQGFGDKIQFARYLPYLRGYFNSVRVVCHESLDMFYSGYECIRAVPADCLAVPICSLPRAFGVVPTPAGYLAEIPAYEFSNMQDKIDGIKRLNIGVVWTGSKTHSNDHNRSCPAHEIIKLVGIGNLYSLNPADVKLKGIVSLAPKTWAETTAYVKGLDVIVTVDTSIVHLACSLGKPVIMMQPTRETDFRWGNTARGHVQPWYPSLTIVHNPNNWGVTINKVKELLSANNF